MFSTGSANSSLAVAEVFRALGHTVELVQTGPAEQTWWDDCRGLAEGWTVVPLEKAMGYDLVVEIGGLTLSKAQRAAMAKASIWVIRHSFILSELESALFPLVTTPKRELEGLTEVWILDTVAAAEEGAVQALELLTRVPVRVVPFVWSPSVAQVHAKEMNLGPWIQATFDELKRRGAETPDAPVPGWTIHVAETNTTNASSAVLPVVILREAKRRGAPIEKVQIFNTDMIGKNKFFMENIWKNSTDAAVGLSGELHARQRCIEWVRKPFSCVLSHLRFQLVRPMLLDLAWMGMPIVHNSPLVRDLGEGYDQYFYSGNHIGEAVEAFERMRGDMLKLKGIFHPGAVEGVRGKLVERFAPAGATVQTGWREALERMGMGAPMAAAVPVPAAAPAVAQVAQAAAATPKTFRVGFCDMWDEFNPAYNFFTLMLAAAAPHLTIVGEPATPESNVVIFGPFGDTWRSLPTTQPKVHFTGENTPPITGEGVKLNLGFHHMDFFDDSYLRFPLWILEIDWFGADPARIQNPKPISLQSCTTVDLSPAAVARRSKFCAFVVSNPNNPIRNAAFHWLSDYKGVNSAGRLFNNVGDVIFAGRGGGGGELMKMEFFRDYKFVLAFENNSARGYTTEKYLHAKAAGAVPIYWGDPDVERDFDMRGAIDARKVRTPEQLVALVRAVDENPEEWKLRAAVPALDAYKVEWCRRTMAELARRLFTLGGQDANFVPRFVAIAPPPAAAAGSAIPAVPAAAPAVAAPAAAPRIPLCVTYTNRRFLSSLQQWLNALAAQRRAVPQLEALVFLGSDVPADSVAGLRETFPFATFETVPDSQPPAGGFLDFWEAGHYGWKLWIYNELNGRKNLAGRLILYMDAGSFMCRWPREWLATASTAGVCLLEDPREENARWCSPEFCAALGVTEAEKGGQQRLGGLVAFCAGSAAATRLFSEAYSLALRREMLVGPKWQGTGADGRPFGHRHDQSILSILSLRHDVPVAPLDTVYCDISLRKTFMSGRSIYVHRGDFKVHKKFAERIDEAYVINLDRRSDRMERLLGTHPELAGRLERWSAVEGRTLKLTPALRRLLAPNDFFWKKAVTGCALSHLGLWSKLAREHPDMENYLILEDDVKFRPGWETAWRTAVEEGHVPDDYDILYLGGVLPPNRGGFEGMKERVNESFVRVAPNQMWGQQRPTRYFHFCAYAYILSRQGAQKVMDLLRENGGYWTSADHILCNPVERLKAYVLDPEGGGGQLAGCYQDDDPKYAGANFNDFSRIDGFDSDLWNNDERFSAEEIAGGAGEGAPTELNIEAALADARGVGVGAPVAPAPAAPAPAAAPELPLPALPNPGGRRFLCLPEQGLDASNLYEFEWLMELYGQPKTWVIERLAANAPAPSDCPIVIIQRPHTDTWRSVLRKWSNMGATFSVLHLSDEYDLDPAQKGENQDRIDFYEFEGCVSVLRFYLRDDIPKDVADKVITIPLGYHWSVGTREGGPLRLTPQLPFRETAVAFFGTGWCDRESLLRPLTDLSGATGLGGAVRMRFFGEWNDAKQLGRAEYLSTLVDTVFVPCPDGMNPETYRFYEALEAGAVPLVVRTEKNAAWVDWITENIPLVTVDSWEEAAKMVVDLSGRPQMLETYRTKLLEAWLGWKQRLRREVETWLADRA